MPVSAHRCADISVLCRSSLRLVIHPISHLVAALKRSDVSDRTIHNLGSRRRQPSSFGGSPQELPRRKC